MRTTAAGTTIHGTRRICGGGTDDSGPGALRQPARPLRAPSNGQNRLKELEHLIGRDGRLAVIDVETTGVYNTDRIVEIAILTMDCDGRIHDEFETLVQPRRDVGPTWIHGIEAIMVRTAHVFADVAHHVAARRDGAVVVGHNVTFDTRMIGNELTAAGIDIDWGSALDTLRVTRCKLGQACVEHGIALDNAHRAIADARALRACYSQPAVDLPILVRRRPLDHCTSRHYVCTRGRVVSSFSRPRPIWPNSPAECTPASTLLLTLGLLDRAMADLKLTPHERQALSQLASDVGPDERAVARAHREFINGLVDAALEDHVVTDDEYDQLCRAAALLNVDSESVKAA